MMRDHKFRAWDKAGIYTDDNKPGMIYGITGLTFFDHVWHSREFPKMEWTGLTDKNGRDIYEGDVIMTEHQDYGVIIFGDGGYYVSYCGYEDDGDGYEPLNDESRLFIEVIGNKYANPELLEPVK